MKKSLIFALALMMVLAFATSAMAAQAIGFTVTDTIDPTIIGDTYYTYTPTVKTFTPDGTTQYPYEIYLPNEVNPDSYKIHSSYTKNTDACASCHSVHTGVNEYLLQWYTVYETCMACHDGTIATTYDVARGISGIAKFNYSATADPTFNATGKTNPAPGGMFGYTGAEKGLSKHNVTGEIINAGAPGGGVVADAKGTWTSEFSCDACHDPHGVGGNARLLKGDVNGAATAAATAKGILKASDFKPSGNLANGTFGLVPNVSGLTGAGTYKYGIAGGTDYSNKTYYSVKATAYDELWTSTGTVSYNLGQADPYMFPASVKVWVYGYNTDPAKLGWEDLSSSFNIDNQKGYTRAIWIGTTSVPEAAYVRIFGAPQIKVIMKINNYLNAPNPGNTTPVAERVYHISGMNPFCGACHTDYNTASKEVYDIKVGLAAAPGGNPVISSLSSRSYDTGAYSKAHRHTVARSGSTAPGMAEGVEWPMINIQTDPTKKYATTNLSCLGCHVAHGAGTDWWNNYLVDRVIVGVAGDPWSNTETTEIAGSSALKRMPNMGVCMNCHNMQRDQVGYAANSGQAITTAGTPASAALATQVTANYVGSSQCFRCHAGAVQEWVETQHNMFAPYDNELASNYLKAFNPGMSSADAVYTGFTTDESITLLEELYTISEAYDPDGAGPIPTGVIAQFKADLASRGGGYANTYNQNISEKDIFSVGQLPVGTRAGKESLREYVGRYFDTQGTSDPADDQFEYCVIGAAVWDPTLNNGNGEWEVEGAAYREGDDNYTGSCFNCHASLTSCDASASGSATEAGKDNNRKTLDQWYAFLYEGGGRPGIDIGITCEACHGQASNHVANPSAENITNPANLTMTSQSQVCGRCHVSSGNKNAITTIYSVWKLDNNTAITAGSVNDLIYAGPYAGLKWSYNTYGTQMDAYFSAGWESYTDVANATLPTPVAGSSSVTEWTYFSKEGRAWGGGGHTHYTTFATSPAFRAGAASCVTCHASHGGDQISYQLKATAAATCASCHDAMTALTPAATAANYMPEQIANEVVMHDFGVLSAPQTGVWVNSALTQYWQDLANVVPSKNLNGNVARY